MGKLVISLDEQYLLLIWHQSTEHLPPYLICYLGWTD